MPVSWLGRLSGKPHRNKPGEIVPHYETEYRRLVERLVASHPHDVAMELAVGGNYETRGRAQVEVLTALGLADGMSVVDIGCGSGRTACKIAERFPNVQYLGIDVVEMLLAHAATKCPPHFRFVKATDLRIPLNSAAADMVLAFSVFTHLTHEESYLYLEEAIRVLKPGGLVVVSFLEMADSEHREIFKGNLAARRAHTPPEIQNVFIERTALEAWASQLGVECRFVASDIAQSLAALAKPGAMATNQAASEPASGVPIERSRSSSRAAPVPEGRSETAVPPRPSRHNDDVLLRIADRYSAYLDSSIATRISDHDDMFAGDLDAYLAIGRSAIVLIAQAMIAAKQDRIRSVLDLPCGGGRVTRHLVPFLPTAEIFACDIDKQKEGFVVDEFGAKPFAAPALFASPPRRQFDLIFVGSLLTHLKSSDFKRATRYFIDALSNGGLLVITTHGRRAISNNKVRENAKFRSTMRNFDRKGYGFQRMHQEGAGEMALSYGNAFTAPSWLMRLLETERDTRIIAFHEAAWGDNQDAIVLQKRAIELPQA